MVAKVTPLPKTFMIGVKHHRPGISLVELLVVAALFAVSSLVATSVFIDVQSSQRNSQQQQKVTADARSVVETIARTVRTGMVNYGTGVFTNPVNAFSVVDPSSGVVTCFRYTSSQVQTGTSALGTCVSDVAWNSITPSGISVDALAFFITPQSDPFRAVPRSSSDCRVAIAYDSAVPTPNVIAGYDASKGVCACGASGDVTKCFTSQTCEQSSAGAIYACKNPNIQPQVTIALTTTSATAAGSQKVTANLQTTVTSRVYQR